MTLGAEIVKVADLARLELTSQEQKRFGAEFEKIVAYFAELQRLKLEGELFLGYPCPRTPDEPRDYVIEVEKLSKHLKDGYFKIPPLLA